MDLASAFQLASFRYVIASLWPLVDTFGTVAARTFYVELSGTADGALHRTTLAMRDHYQDQPDLRPRSSTVAGKPVGNRPKRAAARARIKSRGVAARGSVRASEQQL
ncbi:CHAT domain-containing protein [Streptomyces niveus]